MRVAASVVLLATACLSAAAEATAEEICVVTDHQHPVSSFQGARVIYLDAPVRLKRELSANLPSDRTRAESLARERLREGGGELHRRLAAAYQGVTDAWMLGVSKIPAVIVDRHYVVYGEADVRWAAAIIQEYRRTHP